ncbi:MAG: hypothetical protein ASARMPRED_000656 [Alectoria sarmentosa]|nr:MAG: hypothetical protein ASARMPRED_000656 [Alectoria sarmentosa]
MASMQQSWYDQMPGTYPAEEDEEDEETYLQMMNELAEEECNAGPQQSQHLRGTRISGHQHQHASQKPPARNSSYQMPASHQKQHTSRLGPVKQLSYQKPAGRQHPYARPSVPPPGSHYQKPAYGNQGMRQAGPIRHGGNGPYSQGSRHSQLGFNHQQPSAQQHVSNDYGGYAKSYLPSYDARKSDFSRHRPSQGNFGNENFPPQIYPDFPQSSMLEDPFSSQGQQHGAFESSQDRQYAAYVQRAATMHGPSPYLASSSNTYPPSRPTTSIAASEHGSRPEIGRIDLEPHSHFISFDKEAEKANTGKKKRATKARGPNEEKKPAKSKAKGQTRFKNGRLECLPDSEGVVQQWEPAVRMDDCRRELIDQQNRLAAQLGMSYRDPDPVGTGLNDETAFKIEHADWDSDRAHLPEICWRYNEDEVNNPRPSDDPGFMRFKGMIALDPNDDPVKDWPQLPATLSSKTRGYKLEIMSRQNPHLEYKDFIARMPSVIEKTKKDKDTGDIEVIIEAPDPNVVCNMRMFRFRKEKGLLSWTEKGKTKVIGEGLEKLFGDKLVDNSMRSFGRDLTSREQNEIRKGKDAQFPESSTAGGPSARAATKKRTSRGATMTVKKQNNAMVQKDPRQKRPREDDDDDLDSADDQNFGQATAASYCKRRRNATGGVSKPTMSLINDQDPSVMDRAPGRIEAGSSLTPYASNYISDGYYGEGGNDNLSEDQDQDDGEFEMRTSRRPIHPLPTRHARGGAKKVHLFDPAQTREQYFSPRGDLGSSGNAPYEDTDEGMTDVDDSADNPSSGETQASVGAQAEDDANEIEVEHFTPQVRQETDLERHRRVTREFLGEVDDFYYLPESYRQWDDPFSSTFHPTPWTHITQFNDASTI